MSKVICFDLRALQIGHETRGIGAYIKSVLEHMPSDNNRYLFYCFDKNNPIETLGIETKLNYTIVSIPTLNTVLDSPKNIVGVSRLVAHRFSSLRRYHPDVFVQFDFVLGLPHWRRTKKIVIGYDLIPLIMRNDYMPSLSYSWNHSFGKKAKVRGIARSLYYRFRYLVHYQVYKRADKILCISEATKRTFGELLHIPDQKLAVARLAPVLPINKEVDTKIAEKIRKPFIFYIGGTDARKSIKDIVFAFNIARGRGQDLALVLAGNEFKKLEDLPDVLGRNAIMASPYISDIHLVGRISDAEKLGLYQKAHAFIFPSLFEGFGIPILEAMASSCPVIAYNNSSIPEAAGSAAILVPNGDYPAIAHFISQLANNTERQHRISAGLKQAKQFSWDEYVSVFSGLL